MKKIIGVADQNNSGGYYIKNEHVDAYIAFEGDNKNLLIGEFNEAVEDYRNYCECCGPRWCGIEFRGHEKSDFDFNVDKDEANCIFYHANGTTSHCYLGCFYK